MSELPSGTVTFLFTDIEGSTRLLHELGDAYAEALAEHRRALREAFKRHGGVEVDTQGDAFFVAFAKASDALSAAEEGQRGLAQGPLRTARDAHGARRVGQDAARGAGGRRARRRARAGSLVGRAPGRPRPGAGRPDDRLDAGCDGCGGGAHRRPADAARARQPRAAT